MARKTVGERVDRLEHVVRVIAEDQVSLQKLIARLATETRKGFDRVAKQFEDTDKRMDQRTREIDERIDKLAIAKRETDKKFDERVDKLVIAIGEFIRQQNTRSR